MARAASEKLIFITRKNGSMKNRNSQRKGMPITSLRPLGSTRVKR
ncbi:hypothetical protein C4K09_2192 [Pseudomonas chlororaphis subsp. aureofaciens]|nr:hypothetical protein C4K09_2192 [Pseudomonas chlororaphis subsp. aureofaciens]